MKKYILREYGSWGVMVLSFITGILAGGGFPPRAVAALFSLVLYVNSKQALSLWLRGKADRSLKPLAVFAVEVFLATLLLVVVLSGSIIRFAPYALVPVAYLSLFLLAGEHAMATEITGFLLLALSSLVARFSVDSVVDFRLFVAVALFFTAGVFRVRVQLKKGKKERLSMLLYSFLSGAGYAAMQLSLLPLLPLADNIIFAAIPYRVRLRTTGRIELAKGLLFVILMAASYP
jgi:hypothetical protein